jgi:hypothetical protein
LILSLLVPASSAAQVLVTASYKCRNDKVPALRAFNDTAFVATAQELVNEGRLLSAGTAYHLWGDEWNVVYWYTADDIPGYLAALSELLSRVGQRYSEGAVERASWCTEHRDNIYDSGRVTTQPSTRAPAGEP